MPLKPKIFAIFSGPSRFLSSPATRTIFTSPPRNTDPPHRPSRSIDFASAMESRTTESRKMFNEGFELRLQSLRGQVNPGSQSTTAEDDKRVTDSELILTNYRFSQGDTYAPHDLSFQEQRKRRARKKPAFDAMDLLGINPIKNYSNFSMMSEYVTELGRIKHSNDTGLRPVNQRRMAKAIRRAIGLGLMPAVHRHPEVLRNLRPDKKYITKDW